jgi:hypothetical protein
MRQKKEISPFSIAFLDLLSSALAAVIILFVIVPKTDVQIDVFEDELDLFRGEMDLLDSLYADITEHLAQDELLAWSTLITRLKQSSLEMENQMDLLSKRLEETKVSNESLEQRLEQSENNLREMMEENRKLRTTQASLQRRVARTQQSEEKTPQEETPEKTTETRQPIAQQPKQEADPTPEPSPLGDFLFGMNPEFAVMINWEDQSHSFDLYLKTENRFTDNHNRSTSFGRWLRIPRRYNPTPHQVIIQNEVVPGEYEIYVHLFRPRNISATFNGFIAFQPEGGTPRMVQLGEIEIPSTPPPYRDGGGVLIGTLKLTETTMEFNKLHR